MADITARFTLTGEDYEGYLRYFYAHTLAGRRHMRRLYAIGIAAFLLFVWKEYDHPKFGISHPGYFAAYLAISGALLGVGYWYAITRLWPFIAQSAVRMSGQKGMFTETTLTIGVHSMEVATSQGVGTLPWTSVEEVADTDEALYLFMGGINAFILPKRGFATAAEGESTLACILNAISTEESAH
tara:strand:- start:411 stop:965 length:555 start_codon:yes stop_codon:yes gene_type:complete